MKKIVYAIALIGLFSACNNSKNSTETQVPAATQGGLSGLQNTAAPTTESQTGLLTNPEHGKPGHDCALPVGAPLKQKSSTSQTAAPAPNSPTAPEPVAAQPSSAQKLNPAHGMPGHDCAKPVGAPLS